MVGDVQIAYQSRDDATAEAGKWNEAECAENAQSAVPNEEIVGWNRPFNSGRAKAQIANLNEAGLVMVSPNNTYVGLTKPGGEPDEPERYTRPAFATTPVWSSPATSRAARALSG